MKGNEEADKAAKAAAGFIGPCTRPPIRYLSAVCSAALRPAKALWEARWTHSSKGRYTFRLTPRPAPTTRMLYAGLSKGRSALATQLRTGKIGFNAFLHERRVPSVLTPRCQCGLGDMTVIHVLLACPSWSSLRRRFLNALRTTDIRKILGTPEGIKAAVRFTLATHLLPQFERLAQEEQETRERSAGPSP